MPGASRTFCVPCRCSAVITVGQGQAGSRVTCPGCGAAVEIPRLRELAAFEVADQVQAPKSWRASQGWLLVGVVVAVSAAGGAALFSSFDGGAGQRLPDEQLIRAAVESADVATLHKAWLAVKRSGVDRGAVPEEIIVKQTYDATRRVALLLWWVAAIGLLAAVAGGIACVVPSSGQGVSKR